MSLAIVNGPMLIVFVALYVVACIAAHEAKGRDQ